MTEADYKKLSLLISKYCPDFVVEDHPKFISFLRAYYDWSMNVKQFNPWAVTSHLIEWGDIDETIDEFIDYFKEEYLNNLNLDFNGDIQKFIKHTKEFYASKGTPESFQFLLQLISGNSGEIFYPNQFLMKSSDGEWRTDYNIFVEFDDRIDNSFISTIVKGVDSGATGIVESIETHFNYFTQDRFFKVVISGIKGEFNDSQVIFANNDIEVEVPIYQTIKSVNITSGGNNYQVGDTLSIPDDPTFICRVEDINSGRVDSYAILDGGTGYSVGDVIHTKCGSLDYYSALPSIYVDEVDPTDGAITSLDIRYPGYGMQELPVVDSIESASHLVENKMVPSDYTPVKYIENDGVTYLDSGIALDNDYTVEIKFKALSGIHPDVDCGFFGSDYLNNTWSYGFGYNEENSTFISYYDSTKQVFPIDFEEAHYIKREGNKLYIDKSLVYENEEEQFSTVNTASFFATTTSGGHSIGKCQIYLCRIYDGDGALIANYVPVKRDSDSKPGLYDTVSNTFLTNDSGTDFTAGPDDIIMEDAIIEFISDGCGSINRVSVVSAEINYVDGTPLVINSTTGEGATATISTGNVFETIPYYYKPGSFLSDDFKLQDSDYWQEYSYEIQSSLSLDSGYGAMFSEYKDIFRRLVHPAGFKLFNSFILSNHISLDMLYVNSTIQIHSAPSFIDLVNWIEMVSSWNRIVDSDIIWQFRLTPISDEANVEIGSYRRTGGEFVHSTLEIEE